MLKILKKHKFISLLVKVRLLKSHRIIEFNDGCKAFIDLLDPEPRNVFIKEKFEEHFFEIAEAFLPYKGIFF